MDKCAICLKFLKAENVPVFWTATGKIQSNTNMQTTP